MYNFFFLHLSLNRSSGVCRYGVVEWYSHIDGAMPMAMEPIDVW